MRMAQSQNMKLRRFRSRREFKKYLILAPPGQMYQLVFRIARTGQKQFYYLTENTFCSQQSILLRSTSCTFCTLYERILFRLNKKNILHSIQIGDQWRFASCSGKDPSIQDQAWESIPLFACPRHIHLVISTFLQINIAFLSSSSLKMLLILYPVR